eukprot:3934061-Pyramimonas_sp.AAC.1
MATAALHGMTCGRVMAPCSPSQKTHPADTKTPTLATTSTCSQPGNLQPGSLQPGSLRADTESRR